MRHDDWSARIFTDKIIKKAVQDEIETLALVVLGNHQLDIKFNADGFDHNVYCNGSYKEWCPGGKIKRYMGSWRQWIVFGETKTDVYLEVLRCLANDSSLYIPITSWNKEVAD